MDRDILPYTVLVFEEYGLGVWVKIPEFDMQCLTDVWEEGVSVLEEHLAFELSQRRRQGEYVPHRLVRTVRHVDRDEYGPTQLEIEERRQLAELEEEDDEGEAPGPPVVRLHVRSEPGSNVWVAELPGILRGTIRERSLKKLMLRARVTIDKHFGYNKCHEREGKERPYAAWLSQPLYPMYLGLQAKHAFEDTFASVPTRVLLLNDWSERSRGHDSERTFLHVKGVSPRFSRGAVHPLAKNP